MPKAGNVQQKETPTSCGPDAGELIRAQKKKLQFEGVNGQFFPIDKLQKHPLNKSLKCKLGIDSFVLKFYKVLKTLSFRAMSLSLA
jgi:hypothetical protein